MNKFTNRQYHETVITLVNSIRDLVVDEKPIISMVVADDMIAKAHDNLKAIDKKNANAGVKRAEKKADDGVLIDMITEILSEKDGLTVSEILKERDNYLLLHSSNQKVTSLLKELRENGTVSREEKGKKAFYSLI